MLNYIRAELYKVLRRKYTYVALAIMLALEGLFVSMFVFHNAHSMPTPFSAAVTAVVELGTIGFAVCLLTGDIVFAGQYKNSTLKNEVSFGLSRARIYLGKLIAQTLLSLAYLVVMMAFFVGVCAIALPHVVEGFPSDGEGLAIVGYFLSMGLPLWVGAQAAVCMCLFLVSGETAASFTYVGLVFMLSSVVEVAGLLAGGPVGDLLVKIHTYFPSDLLNTTVKSVVGGWASQGAVGGWVGLEKAWVVGLFWLAACTAVGLYGFHRKEIK